MMIANTVAKWRPREKPLKKFVVASAFLALGSAMETAAILDKDVRNEVKTWKDPMVVMFEVLPNGPYMVLEKRNGRLRYLGMNKMPADLAISFKTLEGAFLVMSAQIGTPQSYAEHRATLKGDVSAAMSLIRCLNIVQGYLFPKIISKRVLKRVPPMNLTKHAIRAVIYALGVPYGLRRL